MRGEWLLKRVGRRIRPRICPVLYSTVHCTKLARAIKRGRLRNLNLSYRNAHPIIKIYFRAF